MFMDRRAGDNLMMNASPAGPRYDIRIAGVEDWGLLAERELDIIVDPLLYRVGQFFLEGREAGPERWKAIAADLGALVMFFDLVVLHDQLPAFNYPDTFDGQETFYREMVYRDRLGEVLNTEGDKTLIHVDVEHYMYRQAKSAALEQLSSRLDIGPFVPEPVAQEIDRMVRETQYEWRPSLENLDQRLPGDRDKRLGRFLLGQLVFTGYAQQTGAPHMPSPQRSRLLGSIGLGNDDTRTATSESAIYEELARRCRDAGAGWRNDELPWTPSFLPFLLETMKGDRHGPDVLLRRAKDLRDSKAVQRYRQLRHELSSEDAIRSEKACEALTQAADKVAQELDSPRQELELMRLIAVEVLPKAFGAGLGALGGLIIAGPPGAVGGAIVSAAGAHALELVNERLWGWTIDRLPFRSARKLLSRSVKAEQELKGQLGTRLEDLWQIPRA
jgi:hypothetical protein